MNTNTVRLGVGGWDVVAFGLEIVALGAVAGWGARTAGWFGSVVALGVLAVVWGVFLSPKAALPVTGWYWPAAKFAVLTMAALALSAVSSPLIAAAYLTLSLLTVLLGGPR